MSEIVSSETDGRSIQQPFTCAISPIYPSVDKKTVSSACAPRSSAGAVEKRDIVTADKCDWLGQAQVDRKRKEIERLQEVISKLETANQALLKRLSAKAGKTLSKSPQKTQDLFDQSVKLIERLRSEIEILQNDKQEKAAFLVESTPNAEREENANCCIFQLPFCL